jgi:hypothetical protein
MDVAKTTDDLQNPYSPPSDLGYVVLPRNNPYFGPALPIVLGVLTGGLLGLPLLIMRNLLGFAVILPGGMLGGLYFRWRSWNWPVSPTARYKRFVYATLIAAVPLTCSLLSSGEPGPRVLVADLGLSIAMGILVSGDRRSGSYLKPRDDLNDAGENTGREISP